MLIIQPLPPIRFLLSIEGEENKAPPPTHKEKKKTKSYFAYQIHDDAGSGRAAVGRAASDVGGNS